MYRLTKARNEERSCLQEENRILKDLLGWKRSSQRARSPPRSDEEEETDSLEEDEAEEDDMPDEEVGDA